MFTLCCSLVLAGLGLGRSTHPCMVPYLERCGSEERYEPQPGDMYFGWSGSLPAKAAYLLVRAGPPSHNGIFVRMPNGEMMVLEATTTERPYGDRPGVFLRSAVWRLQTYRGPTWVRKVRCPLTLEESERLTCFALEQVGKPFSWRRSMLLAPFYSPVKGPLCRKLMGPPPLNRRDWFCSEMLMTAAILLGRVDPCAVKPSCTDPRDMILDRQLDLSCAWEKPARICWK